jgi:hypothetical protein
VSEEIPETVSGPEGTVTLPDGDIIFTPILEDLGTLAGLSTCAPIKTGLDITAENKIAKVNKTVITMSGSVALLIDSVWIT